MNKRMMSGAAGALVLLLGAGLAAAQQRGGDPEQMADRQMTVMKERLKLTADQEKKVRPIVVDNLKKNVELRKKYQVQQGQRPSEEAMAEMKKLREETTKKLSEVLSKEQMGEYEKMMAERRGGGKKQ